MKRKAYDKLLEWKKSDNRKPLILLGARQVGKTWLMREFGANEYDNTVYINCDNEPLTRELFQNDYDIRRLLIGFQAITGEEIHPGSTLIILDEIQEAPRGLHSLKYFCENAPEYHIIAAGSLLGVALSHKESFPVGKVDMINIYPMDFEEFLNGIGQSDLCGIMSDINSPLVNTFSDKIEEYLFQYYYVGGMPEAVKEFANTANLNAVRNIQSNILEAYRMDISKHASKSEAIKIGQVLSQLPAQLAKENKRFVFGALRKGARAADFENAIQWLSDAGLIYKCNRVSKIMLPLKFYEEMNVFKLFLLDVGLLGCMSNIPATIIIAGTEHISEYKGMMTEQYVAQQLASAGISLNYWSNNRTTAELDFVIQTGSEACPVEVKSSKNVRGKSLSQYLKDYPDAKGFRFSLLDYKEQERLTNIPLYELPFWADNAGI